MEDNFFTKRDSQAVKGVAILLMIGLHCFRIPQLYEGFPVHFYPIPEDLVNRVCTYAKICVGIFAFISGYGLSKSYENVPEGELSGACLKRYLRSIRPFWPIYLLTLVAGVFLGGRTMELYFADGLGQGILNLLLGGLGLSHLFRTPMFVNEWWYLSAMVVFIFVVPLFQRWVGRQGWALPTFLLIALPRVLPIGFQGGTEIFTFLFPLLLGILFARYDLFRRLWSPWLSNQAADRLVKVLVTGALALLGYKAYFRLPAERYWEIFYGLIPLSFLLFFHVLVRGVPLAESLFVFLGRHSGNIYFVHTVFLYVFLKEPLYSLPWFALTPLALLGLSLGVSLLLEWCKGFLSVHLLKSSAR